jgi:hypothetical protein
VHGDLYAPAYPSVEGGDRCTDVLGQEIPPNLKLPPQGRPRARAALDAMRGDSACCEPGVPDGVVVPEAGTPAPQGEATPMPMPTPTVPNQPIQQSAPVSPTPNPQQPTTVPPAGQTKNSIMPSNMRMLPSVAPKSAAKPVPAVQAASKGNTGLVLPPDGVTTPKDPTAPPKSGRRLVIGSPSRHPTAPMVPNQLYQSATAPSASMKR